MPSNKPTETDDHKAIEPGSSDGQSNNKSDDIVENKDLEDVYNFELYIRENTPKKQAYESSSSPSPEYVKKEVKVESLVSCSCCSCIRVPMLQSNKKRAAAAKKRKQRRELKNMAAGCSTTASGKENRNDEMHLVTYNTPAKRKRPPQGPFPYPERKFFKSGGLQERFLAQQKLPIAFSDEDESCSDDDESSETRYDPTDFADRGDSSDSDDFSFYGSNGRKSSSFANRKKNCSISC